jgi:Transcriptional regulator, AbiEi antitoxin, Type IV TA system/Transcriptional regulator, AbiEi antitoxin N-terminal domain
VDTISSNKLKNLYSGLQSSRPVGPTELRQLNISPDLVVYYVKAGWLKRLANGVYVKPNAVLELNGCLTFLQKRFKGFHVGGKSALEFYGFRHYLSKNPKTRLYAWDTVKLPEWFSTEFKAEIRRKRLFEETPDAMLNVSPFNDNDDEPMVSEPERAILEMLSDIPVDQTITEAEQLMEAAQSLRPEVMSNLLHRCKSVKTVRLFLKLASSLSLPVYEDIKNQKFPAGSDSNWVYKTDGKIMVLKP